MGFETHSQEGKVGIEGTIEKTIYKPKGKTYENKNNRNHSFIFINVKAGAAIGL